MLQWFVVFCKPNKDQIAERNLMSQAFTVYRPMTIQKCSRTGKGKKVSLFPRYLFLHADPNKTSIAAVKYTRGVSRFVMFGDHYSTLSASIIDKIRKCEQQCARSPVADAFQEGDSVFLNGNGFFNVRAIFVERCKDNRIAVLLDFLEATSKVIVQGRLVSRNAKY